MKQEIAQKAVAATSTVAPTANGSGNSSDWVTISVRRSLYDLVSEFVEARRDATITNITQFADLALRDGLRNVPRPADESRRKERKAPPHGADSRKGATGKRKNCTQSDLNKPRGGESEI